MTYTLAEALQLSDNRRELYRTRAITQIDKWRTVVITFSLISLAYSVDTWDTRAASGRSHREAGDRDAAFTILREIYAGLEGAVWLPLDE
jgi:hypothetical protein